MTNEEQDCISEYRAEQTKWIEAGINGILSALREKDLSSSEGRISTAIICNLGKRHLSCSPNLDRFYCTIENSVNNGREVGHGEDPTRIDHVNQDTILDNWRNVRRYYAHSLVKRPYDLLKAITGKRELDRNEKSFLEKDPWEDEALFGNVLFGSGRISSESLNGCRTGMFLQYLNREIESGRIDLSEAKDHPNYQSVERLVLKADKQQRTLSDLIFKTVSSYVQGEEFIVPNLNISDKERKEIILKCYDVKEILFNELDQLSDDFYHKLESSKYGSLINELEVQSNEWSRNIDFFQPLLERYDSKMNYFSKNGEVKK